MDQTIQSFAVHTVEIPLVDPLATSKKNYDSLAYIIVEVTTNEGVTGFGESREASQITGESRQSIATMVAERFAPALKGFNPFDIEAVHRTMERISHGNTAAKCAVDTAMYDLMGKIAGQPVCRLLGGRSERPLRTSKAISVGTTEQVVKSAVNIVSQGYHALKIKTGVNPKAEIEVVREVRRAVGPEIELKLDANQGWNLADAVKVINAVEDCDIRVVEQPLPEWDLAGAAALRQRVAPPIMLDEAVKSPADMVRIIQAGAADMVNIKLLKTGGIYPALAVNSIAESAGIVCQIGTLDTSIGSAAGAHLATAKENIQFIEINGPTRLKWDVASGLTIQQGRVKIGNGPGYGLEVDRSRLS